MSNRVANVRAEANTIIGIEVRGRGKVVRRCQVTRTGGSTQSSVAEGIFLRGPQNQALDNDVSDAQGTSSGNGISVSEGDGSVVQRNRMSLTAPGGCGATGKYRDNLTVGVTTPYQGGTNAGNNQ